MTRWDLAFWLVRSLLFLAAALPACGYAVRRGGEPERYTAWMVLIAIAATTATPAAPYTNVVVPLLLIDLALLAGVTAVALLADRYWPLYFAGLQLLTVAVHGVRAYDGTILPSVYGRFAGELAYPAVALLALGTWRHVRRGDRCDWSWQVPRDRGGIAGG